MQRYKSSDNDSCAMAPHSFSKQGTVHSFFTIIICVIAPQHANTCCR
jgi:hypothetical protein